VSYRGRAAGYGLSDKDSNLNRRVQGPLSCQLDDPTSVRAPPGSRTPCLRIKSPLLHRYSSRRGEPHRGIEPRLTSLEGWRITTMLVRRGGSRR
jgi:hypothetical protein